MLGALSFTTPVILAALIALPAIWWLLRATPPSPKRVRFPAFIILRQLNTSEETPDRTPWWLLLMRLLLAALIIFGLAGPVLNAPAPSPFAGPLLLVVDDSWAAAANWTTRRNALRAAAEAAAQSDREVYVVTTAPQRSAAEMAPITGEDLRALADTIAPQPLAPDRAATAARLDAWLDASGIDAFEVQWFSDGVSTENDHTLLQTLQSAGDVSVFADRRANTLLLRTIGAGDAQTFQAERLNSTGAWDGDLVATGRDGREIARVNIAMDEGVRKTETALDLPLALRNDLAAVRLENVLSAGAVQLVDARDRRALVGVASSRDQAQTGLLSGVHYIREALAPHAEFVSGSLNAILESDASVIILDDIGTLRAGDVEALGAWIERGGVLIRFAGPVLAEAAQDRTPTLLPVELRGGGRAFGGALTWETPQQLDVFPDDSPFAGLQAPDDVYIRRQVLAQPGGETTNRTWAQLRDGTPLVTGARRGDGIIAMVHVTATPQWSDLPVSETFIQMLRRLTFLSALGPESAELSAQTRFAPLR
ncbi:MAG: BatA domain-containing protein, partial [Hyphococcus sp.]